MRPQYVFAALLAGFAILSACGPHETPEERRRAADTPAGKIGQAAHKAAVEADKASQAIGRQLRQAAHDARAGWKEDSRKERDKK